MSRNLYKKNMIYVEIGYWWRMDWFSINKTADVANRLFYLKIVKLNHLNSSLSLLHIHSMLNLTIMIFVNNIAAVSVLGYLKVVFIQNTFCKLKYVRIRCHSANISYLKISCPGFLSTIRILQLRWSWQTCSVRNSCKIIQNEIKWCFFF